jgi:hypothetical protein
MYNGYTPTHPPGGSGLARWQHDPAAASTPSAQALAGGAVAPSPGAPPPAAPPAAPNPAERARTMLAQRRPPPAAAPGAPSPAAPATSLAPPPPPAPSPTSLTPPPVAAPAFDGTGWANNQSPQQFLVDNPFYGQTGYYGNLQQVQAQVAGHAQAAGKPTGVLGAESYTQNPTGQPLWQPAPTVSETNAKDAQWQQYVDAAGRFMDPAALDQQYAAFQKTGALPR